MNILVTGCAGFVGFHTCLQIFKKYKTANIIGIDILNDYYDVNLKKNRLKILIKNKNFFFFKKDISDKNISKIFQKHKIDYVIHLAAQAGVRYSLKNPYAYSKSNLDGFLNIIELSKKFNIKNFLYASSSSVYGANKKIPFSEKHNVDHPLSLYGATKRANELIAHAYSYMFNFKTTGLRFFTVYGPWGRPDMAMYIFLDAIFKNKKIDLFNFGKMSRDFTYIDDVSIFISEIFTNINYSKKKFNFPNNSKAPFQIFNIGNNNPCNLFDLIKKIEKKTKRKFKINLSEMQKGDVRSTYADIKNIYKKFKYKPKTSIDIGLNNFITWYCEYNKINL